MEWSCEEEAGPLRSEKALQGPTPKALISSLVERESREVKFLNLSRFEIDLQSGTGGKFLTVFTLRRALK